MVVHKSKNDSTANNFKPQTSLDIALLVLGTNIAMIPLETAYPIDSLLATTSSSSITDLSPRTYDFNNDSENDSMFIIDDKDVSDYFNDQLSNKSIEATPSNSNTLLAALMENLVSETSLEYTNKIKSNYMEDEDDIDIEPIRRRKWSFKSLMSWWFKPKPPGEATFEEAKIQAELEPELDVKPVFKPKSKVGYVSPKLAIANKHTKSPLHEQHSKMTRAEKLASKNFIRKEEIQKRFNNLPNSLSSEKNFLIYKTDAFQLDYLLQHR